MGFIILLIILSFVLVIFQSRIKGYMGEKAVASKLAGLSEQNYKIFNDVMVKTSYGTTQIDHVVVSIYGIFVIETKNYKGWITGGEYAEQWTKNMYGKKYLFRNPLKQNYAHVKALEEKLHLPIDKFIPIVAFSSESEIKVKTRKPVVYIKQLKRVIQSYTEIKFKVEELDEIVGKIKSINITSNENKKQHVEQVRLQVQDNKRKVRQGLCPKCGGRLIQRKGRYGSFIGCSNFPRCKYTTKLN